MIVNAITLEQDEYSLAMNAIMARVEERVGHPCHVFYSAFVKDVDIPVDNLDEVAYARKIQFDGKVLDCPTWLDLCVEANKRMIVTQDFSHQYLEGIEIDESHEITLGHFSMGS